MRDIADATGVSQSTVSRILNDVPTHVPIAPETRRRVHEAAQTLGYRPNPMARALRGAPTMLLGAVVREFSNPFFASALEALALETAAHGYNVILGHIQGRLQEGVALTKVLETRHCDAILMFGDMQDQPRLVSDLRTALEPVVALWQGTSPLEFPTVDIDDRAGMTIGLEHLLSLGHERIGLVSAELMGDNRQREDAFVELMQSRFGRLEPGYVQRCPNTLAGGEDALRALLSLPRPPTAIACSTDFCAVGVLHCAYAMGKVVPRDLSVMGFDDMIFAPYTIPALTTLRMPTQEIVAEGVRIAVELARDPHASRAPRLILYEPTLIVRASTAPPPLRHGATEGEAAGSTSPTRG